MTSSPPPNPSWPSLSNLGLEIIHVIHRPPTRNGAHYLYNDDDIFRFTLYWTLIFYLPPFVLCGACAFVNILFPPRRGGSGSSTGSRWPSYALRPVPPPTRADSRGTPRRANEGRSRLTLAVLVLLAFLALGLGGAVLSAVVVAYVLIGLYAAGNYNMSTWIPLFFAFIHSFIGMLWVWPSIINVI